MNVTSTECTENFGIYLGSNSCYTIGKKSCGFFLPEGTDSITIFWFNYKAFFNSVAQVMVESFEKLF